MDCKQSAHGYLDMGWTPVPIGPGKIPWLKWAEFQDRRPSHAEIDEWFTARPDSRVGIVTGRLSGVTVVDIDNSDGLSEFRKLCGDAVAPTVSTPRGGRHVYAQYTPTLINKAAVMPGIDVRNDGGLVVAPDSTGYKWLDGLGKDTPLPPLPTAFIKASCAQKGPVSRQGAVNQTAPLTPGNRNDSLFHILYKMAKGGERGESLEAHAFAVGRATGLRDGEIRTTLESALERARRPEKNLTAEIEDWVKACTGPFRVKDLRNELGMGSNKIDRDQVAVIVHRLKERLIIEPTGKVQGEYRNIVTDLRPVNWQDAPTEPLDLNWAFGIEKLAPVYAKNIIICAGRSNAGKTALFLDFVKRNMGKGFEINYFSSEMAESEAKTRIMKHEDVSPGQWDFNMWDRASHFEDVIRPDAINIVDYLEALDGEEYKVKTYISRIWNKLDKGIALIALQKNSGRDIGRGGEATLDRARLYLALDDGIIKIVKAKNWTGEVNPNGMARRFKLVQGWKFIPTSDWLSRDDQTAEEMTKDFVPQFKPRKRVMLNLGGK